MCHSQNSSCYIQFFLKKEASEQSVDSPSLNTFLLLYVYNSQDFCFRAVPLSGLVSGIYSYKPTFVTVTTRLGSMACILVLK